jgi:5S rRNA maturation endonuclease (ribonuclease M5)
MSRGRAGELVEVALREAEAYYRQQGTPLTLRGLFYILVSKNVIPNTVYSYQKLSRVLAQARYRGDFPWSLLKDTTRRSIHMEPLTYFQTKPLTPEEIKKFIERYIENYYDFSINPWENQRHRVVVALEKEALADAINKFILDTFKFGVYQLRVIRGYDSATDVHNLAETLETIPSEQTPVVLQLGDYDPSGEDIVRDFRDRLMMLSRRSDIIFEKVAVTVDQIIEMQLPAKPESLEEIQKMRRDPRYKKYVERIQRLAETDERVRRLVEIYGSPEIRVELDALVALKPDEFKEILKKAIEKYFDWNIYETVTKVKEEELRKMAEELKKQTIENLKIALS